MEAGEISTPGRAAVERSSGNLFVVDSGNGRVQVFKPEYESAIPLTRFGVGELSAPWGIAIDEQNGQTTVYVADAGNGRIVKYDSNEATPPSFILDSGFSIPSGAGAEAVGEFHAALAIDPTTHDLLVADASDNRVERFAADGTPVGSFDGSTGSGSPGAFTGPIDLAVNSGGDVYLIDANGPDIGKQEGTSRVLRYSAAGDYKATLGPVGSTERPATVAVNPRNDEVLVSGYQDSVYEGGTPPHVPILQPFDAADNPLPAAALNASAQYDTVSGLAISSATTDRLFVVLDFGDYFGSPFGSPQIQRLEQLIPRSPGIISQAAAPTRTEATLRAVLDLGNDEASYRFEYGPTAAYGRSTPAKPIPAGKDPVAVAAQITGLEAGHVYHFRVLISNSVAEFIGGDQTFVTSTGAAPDSCPNALVREQQESAFLPACRAFEMVSPPDKGSQDIVRTSSRTKAAISGDRVTFGSGGAFADVAGVPSVATYMAQRGPDGWATRGLTPAQKTNLGSNNIDSDFFEFSPDLSKSVLRADEPRPVASAPETVVNLFVRDNDSDQYTTVTTVAPPGADQFSSELLPEFAAASSDFGHIVFQSRARFTPDAPENSNYKLYESVGGQIRLVSKLEGGEPTPNPAFPGSNVNVGQGFLGSFGSDTVISDDGRRIYFVEALEDNQNFGKIYRRLDGTSTTEVSRSESPSPGEPRPATYYGASADGTRALFTSSGAMVPGDGDAGSGEDKLYLFTDSDDPLADSNLTLLSADAEPSDGSSPVVAGVVGYSRDLSQVYFVARSQLVAGADTGPGTKLYLWDEGSVRYIANIEGSLHVGLWDRSPRRLAYVTPSGQGLIFVGRAAAAGLARPGSDQAYVYDAGEDRLRCVSCAPGGAGVAPATLEASMNAAYFRRFGYQPRTLSDDGQRAFFNTAAALSPLDSNGRIDVYEWQDDGSPEGAVALVSGGRHDSNSFFADASADGSDVFIVTREPLVGADWDNNADLYDVRVGGGFAEPSSPAPECSGEACQGSGSVVPAAPRPASASFSGPADRKRAGKARKRCTKAKSRRGAKARPKHCAKKRAQKPRPTRTNRGGDK